MKPPVQKTGRPRRESEMRLWSQVNKSPEVQLCLRNISKPFNEIFSNFQEFFLMALQ